MESLSTLRHVSEDLPALEPGQPDSPVEQQVENLIAHTIDAPVLAEMVERQAAPDAANTLERLDEDDAVGVLAVMNDRAAAEALVEMEPHLAAIILEDLNSSNGTFVNGEQIRVRTVEDGATIRFGNAEFIISMPDQTNRGAPAKWSGTSRRSRGPWIVISIVVVLLAAGAVVFAVFADDIFGTSSSTAQGDDPPKPEFVCDPVKQERCNEDETCSYLDGAAEPSCQQTAGIKIGTACEADKDCGKGICVSMGALEGAEVGEDKKVCHTFCNTSAECPMSSCKSVKERPFKVCEFDKNSRKIQALLRAGRKQMQAKDWASAKATYKKILDLDPVDERGNNVQATLNKIEIAEEHKAELSKAEAEIKSDQPAQIADAARRLRRIKKAASLKQQSVYTPTAITMLRGLKKERKQVLVIAGHAAAKKKRCTGILKALAYYDAALAIDPADAAVRKRRDTMRAKKTKKNCQ